MGESSIIHVMADEGGPLFWRSMVMPIQAVVLQSDGPSRMSREWRSEVRRIELGTRKTYQKGERTPFIVADEVNPLERMKMAPVLSVMARGGRSNSVLQMKTSGTDDLSRGVRTAVSENGPGDSGEWTSAFTRVLCHMTNPDLLGDRGFLMYIHAANLFSADWVRHLNEKLNQSHRLQSEAPPAGASAVAANASTADHRDPPPCIFRWLIVDEGALLVDFAPRSRLEALITWCGEHRCNLLVAGARLGPVFGPSVLSHGAHHSVFPLRRIWTRATLTKLGVRNYHLPDILALMQNRPEMAQSEAIKNCFHIARAVLSIAPLCAFFVHACCEPGEVRDTLALLKVAVAWFWGTDDPSELLNKHVLPQYAQYNPVSSFAVRYVATGLHRAGCSSHISGTTADSDASLWTVLVRKCGPVLDGSASFLEGGEDSALQCNTLETEREHKIKTHSALIHIDAVSQ